MATMSKPVAKEGLASNSEIPQVYKAAIERAIDEWHLDGPEDKQWPDYFRGELVDMLNEWELSEDDPVADDEYDEACIWFQAGWKASPSDGLPEFREYARQKYPTELDEDLITMIEDLIERNRGR